ncbi:MAG TPA: glycosyltransferase family 4 protein, partial [Thiolinea sp.]|nr:glycosyltransferase family 4 protein [Thiolinea sp.]
EQASGCLVFSFFYAALAGLATLGRRQRIITLVRGDDVFDAGFKSHAWLRQGAHRLIEQLGARLSTRILTTNHSMQAAIMARTGMHEKFATLPNDITTETLPIPDFEPGQSARLVTVSVLNERKNIHLVLEALARLKHLKWEYLLIGTDTSMTGYEARLKQLARTFGIESRVRFMGWQDHTARLLKDCHLFLLPTLMEGSPNALLEAMGYGLPCQASRIPEVEEILQDPVLLFDPLDSRELADNLERFMTRPGQAELLQHKTWQQAGTYRFDWDREIVRLASGDDLLTGLGTMEQTVSRG